MAQILFRFIFGSEAGRPVVSIWVPEETLFQEALVTASKKMEKDASMLTATHLGGSPISGGTVKEVAAVGKTIMVIDPSLVGGHRGVQEASGPWLRG